MTNKTKHPSKKKFFINIAYNASLAQKFYNVTQKIVPQVSSQNQFYFQKKVYTLIFKILKD